MTCASWTGNIWDDPDFYEKYEIEEYKDMEIQDSYDIIDDNGSVMGFYVKGNYSLEECIKAFEYDHGDDYFEEGEKSKLKVFHCYYRKVPVSPSIKENFSFSHLLIESKKGRGAFEVSVVYFD